MSDYFATIFNSDDFMPHGHCFLWLPEILWLHVISDAIIGLSYFSIPVAIVYFARKRRDLSFRHLFILSGLFIVLCGTTHLFSIWVLWYPDYGPEGIVKALTAIASATTAVIIWKIMPVALTIPSPAELQAMNAQLKQTNFHIEQEVARRTAELEGTSARLQDSEKQLHQAQKMEAIGNLTGGMAHDFNNLLGVIIGNLDSMLERLNGDDGIRQLSQEALDAAMRGADLTRRLLAFARQQPLQPERVNVNELISGITKLFKRTLGEDIRISLELGDDVWPIVADPAQLEAALTNLATNARDAMPHGGRLIIATSNRHLDADYAAQHTEVAPGDYATIEVSDTGSGMPPDIIGRIFEPFFTTKDRNKGTGLGLSMVFGFMKQSGGHINVYSEVGAGTTFRLYLPRAAADTTEKIQNSAPAADNGAHETILVVEDNPAVRLVVMRQLNELGYRVIEAESADAAVDMLAANDKIDLLFSDIVMPGKLNGLDLARLAVARWPALKVILTSGFPETKLNGHGEPATGMRLLSKPYRKAELAATLREALDG